MAATAEGPALFNPGEGTRGIPEAIFIENVEAICQHRKPADVVQKLQELYSKYQYMQSSLAAQRASLKAKLPDIVSALETVNHLVERKAEAAEGETAEYTYQLCENIWCKAEAPPSATVCLWLGANCMLEYTLEEAVELLRTNEANARTSLKGLDEDIAFLRDQITTTEVNIARTHNYGVKLRQKRTEEESASAQAIASPAPSVPAASREAKSSGEAAAAGAGTGAYTWKQEAEEVEVSVRMPKGGQKSDVKVTILVDSLRVEHAGTVLLEGALRHKCSPNGSTWTMTGSRVEVTLEKAAQEPWESLFAED
uniref:CS domain-containing protein n=1 Tax=Alexandrium monilatum TaxID=311494 RepID=A0A7S4V1X5_9DINO